MIDERTRHELFLRLEAVLGSEEAATLMEHLPPVGWAEVATKHDLESLRVATHQEIELLRGEMKHGFSSVSGEIAGLRGEMHGEIAGIRGEIAGMRTEFVTQAMMHAEINRLLLWLFPTLLTALALVFAVARLS